MALIFFKYCLPILLGYTLFVGISGRYIPFMRPRALAKRPSWFLGLWTGAAVAIIMSFGLQLAYQMNLADVPALFAPGAWLLAAAMLPGIIGTLWYRTKITRQIIAENDKRMTDKIEYADDVEHDETLALNIDSGMEMDETLRIEASIIDDNDDQTTIWTDVTVATDEVIDQDETQLFEIDSARFNEPVLIEDNEIDAITVEVEEQHETVSAIEAIETVEAIDAIEADETQAFAREAAEHASALMEVKALRASLQEEAHLRQELETHLRITRKGLAELDSESRGFESEKAAALTQLEQQLEEKAKRTAAAEARAEREAEKRAALESELVHLRQDTLKATKQSRESVEARARALSTANKATTFARQAMEIRTRLEAQLQEAESELESKHSTVSSLIKALEKEKARTQEEVSSMAKQLILHEKQLKARRQLEEVSRSADNKFSTRLVKKVAKARG